MTVPLRFTQGDVQRAVAGVLRAGLDIAKIEIDPTGKIVIIPGKSTEQPEQNDWDDLV